MQTIDYNVAAPWRKSKKLFWKLDGKVVEADSKSQEDELRKLGLKELTKEEKERFKPGMYNPIFDRRDNQERSVQLPPVIENKEPIAYLDAWEF